MLDSNHICTAIWSFRGYFELHSSVARFARFHSVKWLFAISACAGVGQYLMWTANSGCIDWNYSNVIAIPRYLAIFDIYSSFFTRPSASFSAVSVETVCSCGQLLNPIAVRTSTDCNRNDESFYKVVKSCISKETTSYSKMYESTKK